MSAVPFVQSPYTPANFNPSKIAKNVNVNNSEMAKNSKQPKPPDKPLMPYMRYSKKVWDEVRARYPEMKIWEISKIVGQMWRDLPEESKQEFVEAFESEKAEYNEQLKAYHISPAYQSWMASLKAKEHEERENTRHKSKKSAPHSVNSPIKPEGRISLQTMDPEIDDEDDYFSIKHLAAARFYRNHKLVSELFNETVVDPNHLARTQKYFLLRRQAESLETHHNKLDEEIAKMEEKFQRKKRALLESSDNFLGELHKRFTSQPVNEETYQKMYAKALEQFRKESGVVTSAVQAQKPAPTSQASTTPTSANAQANSSADSEKKSDTHQEGESSAGDKSDALPPAQEPTNESTESHELANLKENAAPSQE